MMEDSGFPPDVQVKKGYSWSEQLGIAIACLVESDKAELVEWVKQVHIAGPLDPGLMKLNFIFVSPRSSCLQLDIGSESLRTSMGHHRMPKTTRILTEISMPQNSIQKLVCEDRLARLSPKSTTTVSAVTLYEVIPLSLCAPVIPYVSDEEANAATKDPYLKLVFRLVKFSVLDESKLIVAQFFDLY